MAEVYWTIKDRKGDTLLICPLPKWARNVGVSTDGYLFADSNISAEWAELRIELPHPGWSLRRIEGNETNALAILVFDKTKYMKHKVEKYVGLL